MKCVYLVVSGIEFLRCTDVLSVADLRTLKPTFLVTVTLS
jgi:hypothetical protein